MDILLFRSRRVEAVHGAIIPPNPFRLFCYMRFTVIPTYRGQNESLFHAGVDGIGVFRMLLNCYILSPLFLSFSYFQTC